MEFIEIKKVYLNDIKLLQNISRDTFFETFANYNSVQNMNKYLDESLSISKLEKEMKNENSEFYFASLNDEILGYLKVNFANAQTELKDGISLEIERIYVLKEFHGRNVGQSLYQKAIQIAKDHDLSYVWLGVWENNKRAIQFYLKNGFVEFDRHLFKLGNEEQIDVMMKLILK
jgi:ribosomal protein S18 acetylase RimI-like enzyme